MYMHNSPLLNFVAGGKSDVKKGNVKEDACI